jgi:hypothetical protein
VPDPDDRGAAVGRATPIGHPLSIHLP